MTYKHNLLCVKQSSHKEPFTVFIHTKCVFMGRAVQRRIISVNVPVINVNDAAAMLLCIDCATSAVRLSLH